MAIRLGVALCQCKVQVAAASAQVELLYHSAKTSCRYLHIALHAIALGRALGQQVDGTKGIAKLLGLGSFEHVNTLHAVDWQQVEQRMAPDCHVERDAIDIGLDFAAGTAGAHAADIDRSAFLAAKRAYRVEAGNTDPGGATQGRGQINRIEILNLLGSHRRAEASKSILAVAFNHRRGGNGDRRKGGGLGHNRGGTGKSEA